MLQTLYLLHILFFNSHKTIRLSRWYICFRVRKPKPFGWKKPTMVSNMVPQANTKAAGRILSWSYPQATL